MPLSRDPVLRQRQLLNLRPRPQVTREGVAALLNDLRLHCSPSVAQLGPGAAQETIERFLDERIRQGVSQAATAEAIGDALPALDGEAEYYELIDPYAGARELLSH